MDGDLGSKLAKPRRSPPADFVDSGLGVAPAVDVDQPSQVLQEGGESRLNPVPQRSQLLVSHASSGRVDSKGIHQPSLPATLLRRRSEEPPDTWRQAVAPTEARRRKEPADAWRQGVAPTEGRADASPPAGSAGYRSVPAGRRSTPAGEGAWQSGRVAPRDTWRQGVAPTEGRAAASPPGDVGATRPSALECHWYPAAHRASDRNPAARRPERLSARPGRQAGSGNRPATDLVRTARAGSSCRGSPGRARAASTAASSGGRARRLDPPTAGGPRRGPRRHGGPPLIGPRPLDPDLPVEPFGPRPGDRRGSLPPRRA